MFFKCWGAARNWLLNCSTISVWNEKKATACRSLFYSSLKHAASLFEEIQRAGLVVRNADDVVDVIGFLLQLTFLDVAFAFGDTGSPGTGGLTVGPVGNLYQCMLTNNNQGLAVILSLTEGLYHIFFGQHNAAFCLGLSQGADAYNGVVFVQGGIPHIHDALSQF